jgi:hypothetical protein
VFSRGIKASYLIITNRIDIDKLEPYSWYYY